MHNGHEYVDLGLPSGTLWATCNVGATKPEEYGDYFAWGEVRPRRQFFSKKYKWFFCEKILQKNRISLRRSIDFCTKTQWYFAKEGGRVECVTGLLRGAGFCPCPFRKKAHPFIWMKPRPPAPSGRGTTCEKPPGFLRFCSENAADIPAQRRNGREKVENNSRETVPAPGNGRALC